MIRIDFFDENRFRYALYEVNDLLYLKHIGLIFCLYVKKGNPKKLWTFRKKRRHALEVQISSIRILCQAVLEITVYLTLFCSTFFYCGIGCIRYGKCISVYLLAIVYLSRFIFLLAIALGNWLAWTYKICSRRIIRPGILNGKGNCKYSFYSLGD